MKRGKSEICFCHLFVATKKSKKCFFQKIEQTGKTTGTKIEIHLVNCYCAEVAEMINVISRTSVIERRKNMPRTLLILFVFIILY